MRVMSFDFGDGKGLLECLRGRGVEFSVVFSSFFFFVWVFVPTHEATLLLTLGKPVDTDESSALIS